MKTINSNDKTTATPELTRFVVELIETSAASPMATLADIRVILISNDMFMSSDGEIMYKADRTSLLIELDELIELHGVTTSVMNLIGASPA